MIIYSNRDLGDENETTIYSTEFDNPLSITDLSLHTDSKPENEILSRDNENN